MPADPVCWRRMPWYLGGGELAELSPETMKAFDEILPAHWSHNNPVDILGDAEPERYAKSLEIAAKDPAIDGMLVILTPQEMTDPTQIAEKLKPYAKGLGKPVLASWMGGAEVAAGEQILNHAGIPTLPISRHCRPRLQLHVALHLQPEGTVRDAVAAAGQMAANSTAVSPIASFAMLAMPVAPS